MAEQSSDAIDWLTSIGAPLPKVAATDWVVLELSSFQLCDLRYSPAIAVCLMVVP
jgi:UDP-N-acetylmuramoylalanine-D-glutamate ligase